MGMYLGAALYTIIHFLFIRLSVSKASSFPPPLDIKEEKRLFRLAREGNEEARGKLIEHNLRLVAHIIKKYYTSCKEQEDLLSIGTIGLIKAIDSYDVDNGTRFATYAGKCLQNEILMYFRSQKKLNNETSLHDVIELDKDGNPLTYLDIISVDDTIVDTLDLKEKSYLALKGINHVLNEREQKIIVLRYGLGNSTSPVTQREVAKRMGISRSYVSRLEKSALEKLQNYMDKPKKYI
ncbi:MAG TPA: RNA polymerase subunit sigma-70 [Clostridiales bacterium]|jgi:RNA polymerase sporulation-specific sigma factor|nr:RNA polymerase subunit sigma-70 [Clostridiales bacterium]